MRRYHESKAVEGSASKDAVILIPKDRVDQEVAKVKKRIRAVTLELSPKAATFIDRIFEAGLISIVTTELFRAPEPHARKSIRHTGAGSAIQPSRRFSAPM